MASIEIRMARPRPRQPNRIVSGGPKAIAMLIGVASKAQMPCRGIVICDAGAREMTMTGQWQASRRQ